MSLDSILRSVGKNLFDINTTPQIRDSRATYSISGTTITFKSNNTTNNSFYYSIPVEIGKTYTVSVNSIDWDSTSLGIFLSSTNAPDSNNYGIINKTTLSKTFTATTNTLWIHGYLSYSAGDFTFTFDKLQVEEGTTATSYEPYQQGPKTIIIPSNSKNLIKYPYTETTKTQKDVTFTDNGDGTITVNGTSTGLATFTLGSVSLDNTKSYFLSGKNTSSNLLLRIQIGQTWRAEKGNGLAISQAGGNHCTITLGALKGFTFDNVIIYPQLEEGSVATDYELNTGSKEVLKVSYNSRNLFDKNMSFTNDNKVTDGAAEGYLTYFIQLQPNTQYYVKCFAPVTTDATVTILSSNKAVNSDVKAGITLSKQLAGWKTELALTTDDTGRLYVGNNANSLGRIKQILSACNLQIELGNKATEYVQYSREVVWEKQEIVATNKLGSFKLGESVLA